MAKGRDGHGGWREDSCLDTQCIHGFQARCWVPWEILRGCDPTHLCVGFFLFSRVQKDVVMDINNHVSRLEDTRLGRKMEVLKIARKQKDSIPE